MKTRILSIMAGCLVASGLLAQPADQYVNQGRAWLRSNDLARANAQFNQALSVDPMNPAANALAAATRLLLLPQVPAGSNFLNRIGFAKAGRDLYNWTAVLPEDAHGHTILPANFNSTEAITFFRANVMPLLAAARTNLARISDTNFTLVLSAAETSMTDVTIDYGDILLLRALLYVGDFVGYTANAHNFSVVLNHLKALGDANQMTVQRILADYPSLLAKSSATDLAASKGAFINAVASYQAASDFMRGRAPGLQRLFTLAASDQSKEAEFRDYLTKVRLSLDGPVQLTPSKPLTVNAGRYFAGAQSLRSLLPRFSGNQYVRNSLPDYTFGALISEEPAWEIESFLRSHMGPKSGGYYLGEILGMEYVNYTMVPVGSFALFVGTNQNATLMGYVTNLQTGIFLPFKLDSDGSWYFETNGFYSGGWIHDDGTLEGQLSGTNGFFQIAGEQQLVLGPFQAAAGRYSGSWTVPGAGSGALQAIFTAAGQLCYASFASSGSLDDGGWAQLNSSTKQFTSVSVRGATVQGALNPATLRISGTVVTDHGTGTFTLARGDQIPYDVAPVLASPLSDKSVVLGANATFAVTATGSPPLSYQWYSNGVAITKAASATLVVSNVQWASDQTLYGVTVQNCATSVTTSAMLHVVPETNRPLVKITAPTAGQRWSNAVFIVRGTASDNAGVSNVWCRLNQHDWQPAVGTTAWSLEVFPDAGTNVIRVYAVDISGNVSLTNSASLVYVLTSPLTLITNGIGTITRNFAGTQLEINKPYKVTAVPGVGQVFSNWIGTVTSDKPVLNFVMQSNMVLQADFVPNPFVAVKGTYNGLFAAPANEAMGRLHGSSGSLVNLLLTDRGSFTATLWLGGKSYPVKGQFGVGGTVTTNVVRLGTTPLAVTLALDMASGANHLSGSVSDGTWVAQLSADRQTFSATTNRARYAGKYTLILPGEPGFGALPGGDSYLTLTVDAAGKVVSSGRLADDTLWTPLALPLSQGGLFPLYASLYTGAGSTWGWISFDTNLPPDNLHGQVSWIKPGIPTAKLYPAGFTNAVLAEGSGYVPPTTNRVVHWTNGIAAFDGSHLASPFTNNLLLKANNQMLLGGTNLMVPGLTAVSGAFSGKATVPGATPASKQTVTVQGAIFQNSDAGFGYFVGTNKQSGRVYIGPPSP